MPENTWKGILDRIREKTGKADLMTSGEVANEIANITTGFPNGTKWTQSNLTSSAAIVHYSNGFWYCTSYNGIGLYYSLDGKEWIATNIKSGFYTSIEYNNRVWIGAWYRSSSSYSIIRSIDGINWEPIGSYKGMVPPVYGKGLWVAGLREGQSDSTGYLAYSSDGLNWTPALSDKVLGKLIYADGVWLATLGDEGATYKSIYYSTDGKEWICSNIVDAATNALYAGNGMFLAGGNGCVYHSLDGKEWSTVEIDFKNITCVNGIWFGHADDLTYYSEDGIVWAETNIKKPLQNIYYSNNVWVATYNVGKHPNEEMSVLYSTDGKEWYHSNLANNYCCSNLADNAIVNANGIWIMSDMYRNISYGGKVLTNNFYSLDGKNWIQSDGMTNSIFYANGMWVSSDLQYSVAWEAKT